MLSDTNVPVRLRAQQRAKYSSLQLYNINVKRVQATKVKRIVTQTKVERSLHANENKTDTSNKIKQHTTNNIERTQQIKVASEIDYARRPGA